MRRLHTLFIDEGCWSLGYTKFALDVLKNEISFQVAGGRRSIGGENAVTESTLERCLQPFKAWVMQVHNIVEAEFNDVELWSSFSPFDLSLIQRVDEAMLTGRRARSLRRLAQVYGVEYAAMSLEYLVLADDALKIYNFSAGKSSFPAWQAAFRRRRHRCGLDNLLEVLKGYAMHMGLSTSCVERLFSLADLVVSDQRKLIGDKCERIAVILNSCDEEPQIRCLGRLGPSGSRLVVWQGWQATGGQPTSLRGEQRAPTARQHLRGGARATPLR